MRCLYMMPTIHGRRSEAGTGTCSRDKRGATKMTAERIGAKIVASCLEVVETVLEVTEVKIG